MKFLISSLGSFCAGFVVLLSADENSQTFNLHFWLGLILAWIPLLFLFWMNISGSAVSASSQMRSANKGMSETPVDQPVGAVKNNEDQYVFEYYQNARERLTSQGNRLWNRFNYFLTIETALIGAFFIRPEHLGDGTRLYGLGLLGIIWSLVWFLIAAQDLWFYQDRYEKLKQIEDNLINRKITFTYDPSWRSSMPPWKKALCFKVPDCGSTTFSSICPALFFFLWILILALQVFMKP